MLIYSSFITTLALTCLAMVILSMRRPEAQLAMRQATYVAQTRRSD
jgi:hypothetical protein